MWHFITNLEMAVYDSDKYVLQYVPDILCSTFQEKSGSIWALSTHQRKRYHFDSYASAPTSRTHQGYIHFWFPRLVLNSLKIKIMTLLTLNSGPLTQSLMDSKSSSIIDWLNKWLWCLPLQHPFLLTLGTYQASYFKFKYFEWSSRLKTLLIYSFFLFQ